MTIQPTLRERAVDIISPVLTYGLAGLLVLGLVFVYRDVRQGVAGLQVMTTLTCTGTGRYERVQSRERALVFDTCTGRYYRHGRSDQWEIYLPAIPDIPPTGDERQAWQALNVLHVRSADERELDSLRAMMEEVLAGIDAVKEAYNHPDSARALDSLRTLYRVTERSR